MADKVRDLTGYCGIYCGDCIRFRSKSGDLARDLLSEFQSIQFDKYAEYKSSPAKQFDPEKRFGHYRECCEVLDAIVNLQCNSPCRVGGGCSAFSCDILECCLKEGFQGCWECGEFESCKKYDPLKACHGDGPKKNLKMIKELGVDNWAEHRIKGYLWQQADNK